MAARHAWSVLVSCVLGAFTMSGCSGSHDETDPSATLELISALEQSPPQTVAEASALLGVELPRDEARSTAYYDVHIIHTAGRPFARVELRVPASPRATAGAMLVLDLATQSCVTWQEVQAMFGTGAELSVPSPQQPPDAPVYRVYSRPFGTIHFGFARAGAECLETVVIRREE